MNFLGDRRGRDPARRMASKRAQADTPPAETPAAPGSSPAVETLSIEALVPDAANVRKHGDRNKKVIRRSLAQFGAGRSVVLDGDNVVRAGNGTLEAAAAEGFNEVLVVEPKPGQLVAVLRPDWTPAQAVGYAIADNRASELAEWDHDGLAKQLDALMQEDGFDATTTGFDDAEIRAMIEAGSLGAPASEPSADPYADAASEPIPVEKFMVVIDCRDESHQVELLARFDAEGLVARSIIQ